MTTSIDRIYSEHAELHAFLIENGQLSYANEVDSGFRKVLLLAAASYFESEVVRHVLTYIQLAARENTCVVGLVQNKAISRQYHTYFDWKGRSAGPFYAAFGGTAKERLKAAVQEKNLIAAVQAFLELGDMRNELVHENYADYWLDKTVDEIYGLYAGAGKFVSAIPELLMDAGAPP